MLLFHQLPEVISLGMFNVDTKDVKFEKVEHRMGEGLNLREKRKNLAKIEQQKLQQQQQQTIGTKKRTAI